MNASGPVEKCLTHSNYLIRKVNTNLTQVVHRIRLRRYIPPTKPLDIVIDKDVKFEADNEFPNAMEPQLMDAEKIIETPQANTPERPDFYPHADIDDMFTPVRNPFVERGKSENKTEESPPQGKQAKQMEKEKEDENLEWWRNWDRAKEALNLETQKKFETTERQRLGENPQDENQTKGTIRLEETSSSENESYQQTRTETQKQKETESAEMPTYNHEEPKTTEQTPPTEGENTQTKQRQKETTIENIETETSNLDGTTTAYGEPTHESEKSNSGESENESSGEDTDNEKKEDGYQAAR